MMQPDRLTQLENVIHKNQRSFYLIGKALKEIRDEGLYRIPLFKSFDAYTKERWEIGKSQAYRLIEACQVIDNLSPIGERLPENESQVRPLTSLKPDLQRKIWRDFLKTGMELKALNLRKFISGCKTGMKNNPVDLTNIISAGYKEATLLMLERIREAQNEGWQTTSREAGLFWNKVMNDKILEGTQHNGKR